MKTRNIQTAAWLVLIVLVAVIVAGIYLPTNSPPILPRVTPGPSRA